MSEWHFNIPDHPNINSQTISLDLERPPIKREVRKFTVQLKSGGTREIFFLVTKVVYPGSKEQAYQVSGQIINDGAENTVAIINCPKCGFMYVSECRRDDFFCLGCGSRFEHS